MPIGHIRRMQSPALADLRRAKRTLIYLRDTKDKGLLHVKSKDINLVHIKIYVMLA